jgi:predicted O-methyltransferase YrrM
MKQKPTMHCQKEIEKDTSYKGFLPDETLFKWFNDSYSSSKHLLTLFSLAIGTNAKTLVEIGFGRSTFVLAKAAHINQARFITCDIRDFSYLLNKKEKEITEFVHGKSDKVWPLVEKEGIDFAFLDYFSSESWNSDFVKREIKKCFSLLKENGIICIHDTLVDKYALKDVFNSLKTKRFGMVNKDLEVLSLPYNYGLGIIRRLKPSPYGKIEDTFKKKPDNQ